MWRDPAAASESTRAFVERELLDEDGDGNYPLIDALLAVAAVPQHPLNVDFLDQKLSAFSMPDRDAWWSPFLFKACGEKGSVDRLIDWAWKQSGKWSGEDEVARLAGTTLAWFLTCSHRQVRDGATKGLVRLFEDRLGLLLVLLKRFERVDDPYVSERLAAVAFGAAARSDDACELADLAQWAFNRHFASGTPPDHFLERDYHRQLVELAIARGAKVEIDVEKLRPPYNCSWPRDEAIPSLECDREARCDAYGDFIFGPYGDFAKYLTDFSEWQIRRIDGKPERTPGREFREFQALLTERQLKAFRRLRTTHTRYLRIRRESLHSEPARSAERRFEAARDAFVRTLRPGTSKRARYDAQLADYFREDWHYNPDRNINYQAARRWMSARVRTLGWTGSRFSTFDHGFRTDRDVRNIEESMAKKYTWIALGEMWSRCADMFQASSQWEEGDFVEGPWEVIWGRDIDPSMLLERTKNEVFKDFTRTWWFPVGFDSWREPADDVEWVSHTDDIPEPSSMMVVTDPEGARWVTLYGYYEWEEPTKPGNWLREVPIRSIWLRLVGYFVRTADLPNFMAWSAQEDWKPDSMPNDDLYHSNVFQGELFWSRSYADSAGELASSGGWTRGPWDDLPVPVMPSAERYSREFSAADATLTDSVSFRIPCRHFAESLRLRIGRRDGHWHDTAGQLVAFDPAINDSGAPALLVGQERLRAFLDAERLALVWIVSGTRERTGGEDPQRQYVGHTEIQAVYRLGDEGPVGSPTFTTKRRAWT